MIDENGQEHVWSNGQLVPVDSGSKDKYYTVTVELVGFADSVTDESIKAAAIGSYSGTISCNNSRFVLHATTTELTGSAWLTATEVTFSCTIGHDGSAYTFSGTQTFYVTVDGEGATNDKDFTGTTNNNITGTLSVSTLS